MFKSLFRKKPDPAVWNTEGRRVAALDAAAFEGYFSGQTETAELAEDTRSPEQAEAVLAEVIAMNAAGEGAEARARFDPAHAPFIDALEQGGCGLTQCAILGESEFLVQQGTPYQDQTTWHIQGERIAQLDGILRFAWSRNRRFFLTLFADGSLSLGRNFADSEAEEIPALPVSAFMPKGLPERLQNAYPAPVDEALYTSVSVSDDGNKLLLVDEARGVALLTRSARGWATELLLPSVACGLIEEMEEFLSDRPKYKLYFDMLHAAISPDGRFIALGMQDSDHFILNVGPQGQVSLLEQLPPASSYPHMTCFASDSGSVMLNSCHFYSGESLLRDLPPPGGEDTPREKPQFLDQVLRVYAAGYLPPEMTPQSKGAYLLAGSGIAGAFAHDGTSLWLTQFGSSGGDVDVCPATGRVLIASYSGMLHLIDPMQVPEVAVTSGYRAPLELRRWLFWDRLKNPIIW